MNSNPLSIIDHKLHFLRNQIHNLGRPIAISDSFDARRPADIDPSYVLRQKLVDDALLAVNNQIKRHNKLVYPVQATRHVAEQLDGLYWRAGEKDIHGIRGAAIGEVQLGTDLSNSIAIQSLPDVYPVEESLHVPESQTQYQSTVNRLRNLDERRSVLKDQIATYKALKQAISPMQDAINNIQPNLCTRGSELEHELEKMRTLLARVVGRIAGLEKRPDTAEEWLDDTNIDETIRSILLTGNNI